ncbi:ATP-binding protein [Sulfurovum sp. bin170]|uniref:tetratricopeptide repeat protein n=1 Tax=Sulfurovum sp. bin170 TaxID=2695268 RepID=UPI0013DFE575|nr:tetratricopeptide repeat protein [Sulfurovum sp. bin170]NEW61319.1 ATP-binding protein [Sulfurovum sp. bin170]
MNPFNRVEFIGRVKELETIERYLQGSEEKKLIAVRGIGGIGKTRLLEEVYSKFGILYKICKIIDFDNNYFQIQGSIITHIAKELMDGENFINFFRLKKDYEKFQKELDISDLTLKEHNKTLNRVFVEEFNRFTKNQRVTIVFDTLDKLDLKAIPYLKNLFEQFENILFLIAGRSENLDRLINILPKESISQLKLKKFNEYEIKSYIKKKRINSSICVKPQTEEKIAILSRGKPILIDLAIDRIGIEESIEWLDSYSVDDILFANRHEKESLEKRFEDGLISDIIRAENRIDEYILLLSLVKQASRLEIEKILDLERDERDSLFEYSKNSVLFKNIDNSEVGLHDEISRLLELHIQREGTFPKRERFIDRSIYVLERELEEDSYSLSQKAFIKQRLLRLKLHRDVEMGTEYFIEIFEEEFNIGLLFKYIKPLIGIIESYIDQINSRELKSSVIIHIAHYHIKDGKYDKTYQLMSREYSTDLSAESRVNLIISLVNAKIRIGKFEEAIEASKRAIAISKEEKNTHLEAKSLNMLGWAYRCNGKLSRAITHYLQANQLVEGYHEDRESQILKGWIHNNLAFAYAQKGIIKSATKLAKVAQKIWEKLEFKIGLGALYEVYGEIHLKYGYYQEAITYYNKAIDIFIQKGDKDFSKRAFVERATANIHANRLDDAKEDLEYAVDIYIDVSSLDVRLEFEKGYIATIEDRFEDAKEHIAKAIKIHEFHPNPEYMLFSIYLQLLILIETKSFDNEDKIKEEYEKFKREYPDSNYYLIEAIISKKLGDILLLKGAVVETLLEYYMESFLNFKKHGESEPYSIYSQLVDLDRIFQQNSISSDRIRDIGSGLCRYWEENRIGEMYPETLHILSFWRDGKVEGD